MCMNPLNLVMKKNGAGKRDFEIVKYLNNVQKGTASVIVRGVGDYGGTRALDFKIQTHSLPLLPPWIASLFQ